VENQAIARAIRLRQEKRVIITRYVIKGTVEEVSAKGSLLPQGNSVDMTPGNAITARAKAEVRGNWVRSK
jgi:hypothetical protein